MSPFFFDAYALARIAEAAPSYLPYRDEIVVTQAGHVYEFAQYIMARLPAREARARLDAMAAQRVDPSHADLVEAVKLRRAHSRMSAQDALGYVMARRIRLRFLTGDAAFRKLPGVEFVP